MNHKDIDSAIDFYYEWYHGPLSLFEFVGFTDKEWRQWIKDRTIPEHLR